MSEINYKAKYESMCHAANELQNKVLVLQQQVNTLLLEKEQWAQQKMMQERVFQNSLNNFNERMNKVLEENQRLKNGD